MVKVTIIEHRSNGMTVVVYKSKKYLVSYLWLVNVNGNEAEIHVTSLFERV
jgi:hypothetical protein